SVPAWQDHALRSMNDLVYVLQVSANYRIALGLSGALLIFISFSFAQLILARFQREKTIAFHTASGEVTIALSAIEDLIKHFAFFIPEIRELKPDVIATRKGSIVVNLRVILKSEANIPELTAHLQEITKSKIQEVLGIEESIVIRIHIAKILSRDENQKRRKEIDKEEHHIPIGGYGRV
ncbi:MAG: alkaline shock response membrane anchor protein AmaP, partial [Candidatus Omnitrophica bacterium]|nr:alkaline shock response membrane anchor protein AmaP [Candidatus Omnitrophota bacterium]